MMRIRGNLQRLFFFFSFHALHAPLPRSSSPEKKHLPCNNNNNNTFLSFFPRFQDGIVASGNQASPSSASVFSLVFSQAGSLSRQKKEDRETKKKDRETGREGRSSYVLIARRRIDTKSSSSLFFFFFLLFFFVPCLSLSSLISPVHLSGRETSMFFGVSFLLCSHLCPLSFYPPLLLASFSVLLFPFPCRADADSASRGLPPAGFFPSALPSLSLFEESPSAVSLTQKDKIVRGFFLKWKEKEKTRRASSREASNRCASSSLSPPTGCFFDSLFSFFSFLLRVRRETTFLGKKHGRFLTSQGQRSSQCRQTSVDLRLRALPVPLLLYDSVQRIFPMTLLLLLPPSIFPRLARQRAKRRRLSLRRAM